MKIAVQSDLHIEGYRLPAGFCEEQDYDVLVLAGDIVSANTISRLSDIKEAVQDKPVIYIPGNHEYYRGDIRSVDLSLADECNKHGFIFAKNKVIRVQGTYFICAVGWSDLESFPEFTMVEKMQDINMINDFRVIREHTVEKMVELAKADKRFIINSLEMIKEVDPRSKRVIVTHFAPTDAHGNERFEASPISSYFSNAWEEIMYEYEPDLWIYGHTHGSVETPVYRTRVICNQRGYGNECGSTYNPNKIVTI